MSGVIARAGVRNESIWTASSTIRDYPALGEDLTTDVCVIGAGVAGMSAAYELSQAGKRVAVVESRRVGGGMTSMTTAHLTAAVDDRYYEMERLHGRAVTRAVAHAHTAALDRIEDIVRAEGIACDFARVEGFLTLGTDHDDQILERELSAIRNAGLRDVQLDRVVVYPGRGEELCLRFPQQACFHPLRYLQGLADAISRAGSRIFGNTHVSAVSMAGDQVVVVAGGYSVRADAAVVATNSPITERFAIHTKQAPYMTYVIAAPAGGGALRDMLAWDTEDPYHFVRLQHIRTGEQRKDYVIVGGEDHKTAQAFDAQERFTRLRDWARERFPTMGNVEYAWSGEIMESVDRLAFIGRPKQDEPVYVVTGESGVGITHATIGAAIITDGVLGRPAREGAWAALYDPDRSRLRAIGNYVKENANVVAQYVEWLTPGDVESADAIPPGTGALLRRGVQKIACFRDDRGVLHERSAVCPHLGCIVRWNPNERTWDCPCHGSRFDSMGCVISGPASENLSPAPDSAGG